MTAVIDTNSLLSLVRYYLPFDKNSVLYTLIKKKIEDGEIIIVDKVLDECTYTSKGIILDKLKYLRDKTFLKTFKTPYKTDSLLPPSPAKFIRQVENQFVNMIIRKQRGLSDLEFENQKDSFLESADVKQIVLCLNIIKDGETVVLVTEETESNNDNKLFKKIPAICKELNIETLTLPHLLHRYNIDINFK